MRIDKFISECGLASRRECAQAAKRGLVLVDGAPVRDVSVHIDPDRQSVSYLGTPVKYNKYVYVMLNKPQGYVSATEDSSLPVVTELLPDDLRRKGLFPVGRLDRDTTGLMILTNNGVLAHALLSPKHHVAKRYFATFAEPMRAGAEAEFRHGVTLADGYECKSAEILCSPDRMGAEITLTEGKYHQIKRMAGAMGNRVVTLTRLSFSDITLDSDLELGHWRYLTDCEIASLISAAPESRRG